MFVEQPRYTGSVKYLQEYLWQVVHGAMEGSEPGDTVLRLYRMEPGLTLLRSMSPVLPKAAVVSDLFYDGSLACLVWCTDQGPGTDYWDIAVPGLSNGEGREGGQGGSTRTSGMQLYTGLEGGEVVVTNIFLPTCHAFSLQGQHLVTVAVAKEGDRLAPSLVLGPQSLVL